MLSGETTNSNFTVVGFSDKGTNARYTTIMLTNIPPMKSWLLTESVLIYYCSIVIWYSIKKTYMYTHNKYFLVKFQFQSIKFIFHFNMMFTHMNWSTFLSSYVSTNIIYMLCSKWTFHCISILDFDAILFWEIILTNQW
jgi:hypothetical protein